MYLYDYDNFYPPVDTNFKIQDLDSAGEDKTYKCALRSDLLLPYVGNQGNVFLCPTWKIWNSNGLTQVNGVGTTYCYGKYWKIDDIGGIPQQVTPEKKDVNIVIVWCPIWRSGGSYEFGHKWTWWDRKALLITGTVLRAHEYN